MQYYAENNLAEAINWMGEIRQGAFVNKIGKKLIDQLMNEGVGKFKKEFNITDVDAKLVESSGKLTFIAKYEQFAELKETGKSQLDARKAVTLVMEMVKEKIIPYEYIGAILEELVPFIRRFVAFNTSEIESLLQTLTEYESGYNTSI